VEAHDLAEIREESETDVVGVGHALAVAADRIAGGFRSVVADHSEAIFVPEAVPIATPVASERVGLLQAGSAPTYALRVEGTPDRTRRWRQHPGRDLGRAGVRRATAGQGA